MGLGFDIRNFNEDGSDDVYTIGISMPIHMVQYRDSFTWSKYSCCLFPNDLSRMISDNVDELFRQNLTEFLQTDINGSIDFLLNAITIQSLEKYLRLFIRLHWTLIKYLPFGIKFFLIQKQKTMLLKKYGKLQGKQQLFLFQPSCQYFISVSLNIHFLNQLWSCYSSLTFKLNLLLLIIRYFLGINQSFLSIVFVVKKITSTESIGKVLFMAPMAISHHLKILQSIPSVNDSWYLKWPKYFIKYDLLNLITLQKRFKRKNL
jgi:hypothetical protein